jgi:hypothetical protein
LSVTTTLAPRVPKPPGANVTDTVHDPPAANVLGLNGHVVVRAKSPAFAPLTTMLLIVNANEPEFVNVTDFAALDEPTT